MPYHQRCTYCKKYIKAKVFSLITAQCHCMKNAVLLFPFGDVLHLNNFSAWIFYFELDFSLCTWECVFLIRNSITEKLANNTMLSYNFPLLYLPKSTKQILVRLSSYIFSPWFTISNFYTLTRLVHHSLEQAGTFRYRDTAIVIIKDLLSRTLASWNTFFITYRIPW